MPGAARLSDECTGHGCFPARPNIEGSKDTFADDLKAHCFSHKWGSHCCGGCHASTLCAGSPDVYVNDLPWGRCNDAVCCGGTVATCSRTVYLNS
ncbi:MAG: PaaR repeat-containing protein [Deltaproteobacteria bacterium]|nr:PaaR repeat-containing protein [Deltaproteobacteria bacterium]